MNSLLIDPFTFSQEYPDTLTHVLECRSPCTVNFNYSGEYLAVGLNDGPIVIYDLDTYEVARILRTHSRAITSCCWSQDSKIILSSSKDWKCILWNVDDATPIKVINFDSPIWTSILDPTDSYSFLVVPYEDNAYSVKLNPSDGSLNKQPLPNDPLLTGLTLKNSLSRKTNFNNKKMQTLTAVYHPSAKYIFTGTSKGWVNVISAKSLELLYSVKLTSSMIKQLKFSSNGFTFIINSTDRIIRQVKIPYIEKIPPPEWEFEIVHKYQDVVNRISWNSISFNNNGDYVMGCTYDEQHDIYIWETLMGSLVKILECPKEELVDIAWHPNQPMIAAIGFDIGNLYVWSIKVPQRWAPLAPDFVEVEQNHEYEEKEDEFDIVNESDEDRLNDNAGEEEVDVVTKDAAYSEFYGRPIAIPILLDEVEENFLDDELEE